MSGRILGKGRRTPTDGIRVASVDADKGFKILNAVWPFAMGFAVAVLLLGVWDLWKML